MDIGGSPGVAAVKGFDDKHGIKCVRQRIEEGFDLEACTDLI